ncbi:aldo/keto reductase [Streptomyces sp. NPDC058646]|uniref:aldo/keto reductase n=1 Tax=Streptomyces sp. NPDC058646 TaxID=3346574 RepID=UPI00364DEBF6
MSSTPVSAVPVVGGAAMPMIGFGTWRLSGEDAYRAVLTALEAGYRHIDTAAGYGNHLQVGRALVDSGPSYGKPAAPQPSTRSPSAPPVSTPGAWWNTPNATWSSRATARCATPT